MSLMSVAFVLFFLIGSVLSFVRHPIYGLTVYMGVFYLNPPERWWGQGALLGMRWALASAAVLLLSALLSKKTATPRQPNRAMIVGFALMIVWLLIQSIWALAPEYHSELIEYWIKFLILLMVIPKAIETEEHLRIFLWTHVAGCFYLGLVVFSNHTGGRFEEFGASGVSEANVGALLVVTSMLVAGGLFLVEGFKQKIALMLMVPFILNALVATQSRSGFLSLLTGGFIFLLVAPKKFRKWIVLLGALAGMVFVSLTTSDFWNRMETIKHAGGQVENVDTGGGRLEIMAAQWKMFTLYPFGCGHRCTASLSAQYLDDKFLTGEEGERGRSSHNTYMTLLVEQGIFGIGGYFLMLVWIWRSVRRVLAAIGESRPFLRCGTAGVAGALAAITVGDFFVSHTRFEVRFWLLGGLIALVNIARVAAEKPVPQPSATLVAVK